MLRLLIIAVLLCGTVHADPPATKKHPRVDKYHNVDVIDEYRWLEDSSAMEVKAWSDAQNDYARAYLDKLPGREALRKRFKEILAAPTSNHFHLMWAGGQLFAMKKQPPKERPFLVVMPAADRPEEARTLVDPTGIDKTMSIDWFVPSHDGKLVAVSLSKGGTESGDVHIFETATGKQVHEVIPRVHGGTAGGDLAWTPDNKGFFYTRYPRGDERPEKDRDFYQQLWYHELGTSGEKDRYEIGKDFPRVAEIMLELSKKNGMMLVSVQDGDGGRFMHFLRTPEGSYKQFTTFDDGVVSVGFDTPASAIWAVSRKDAPRGKLIRLALDEPNLKDAKVIVPEGKDTIVTDFYRSHSRQTFVATAGSVYLTYQTGGPSEIRAFDRQGKPKPFAPLPAVGTARGLEIGEKDSVFFVAGSYLEPAAHYLYGASGATKKLPLSSPPPVKLDDIQVVREFATSKDGAKVPVNILFPKKLDRNGKNPCILTGYGGYGISLEPGFNPTWRVLFDKGFVVAVANLRGGGEYGAEWHKAGTLTRKQNVFDDFAAAMQLLKDQKFTDSEHLAIQGGSNGGLLMGAALTQHPSAMKAVVSHVGIYDMLRVELSPNGAFNVPEFGSVKDKDQFNALYAYSPFHNVKDGTKYPATLFLTGANDPRVDPMQSRKMTARLQAATASKEPILLRTSSGGHGMDTGLSQRIEELTDVYSFLFDRLGVSH